MLTLLLLAACHPDPHEPSSDADPTGDDPGGDPPGTGPTDGPTDDTDTGASPGTGTPPGTIDPTDWPMPPGIGTGPTFYVSTAGDDRDDGTTVETAFATLERGVAAAEPGSIVYVLGGDYDGTLIQDGSFGRPDAWIRLTAYDATPVTIHGGGGLPAIYVYADSCDEDNDLVSGTCDKAYWRLDGLSFEGDRAGSGEGVVIKIDTPQVQLVGNRLCCSVADVVKLVRTADDVVIVGNELYQDPSAVTPGSNAQGVDITGADRVVVAGNWFHDLTDIAMYAKGNARDTVFDANRVDRTGLGGEGNAVMCGQSTDAERLVDGDFESYGCRVTNNVISHVTGACVAVGSSQGARVYANTCYDTGTAIHAPLFLTNESEIGTRSVDLEIRGNIVVQPSGREVFTDSDRPAVDDWSTVTIDENLYFVDGDPVFSMKSTPIEDGGDFTRWNDALAAVGAPPDTSRIVDPELVSASDLHLAPTSPAVDAGPCLVDHDADGAPRPQGAGCDLGAYEQ
ncbi:MAG: right-handed parallel beta-helix repeat-containing protein [Myxococcota bacterium]